MVGARLKGLDGETDVGRRRVRAAALGAVSMATPSARATLSAPRTSRGGARPSVAPSVTSSLSRSRGSCDVEVTRPHRLKVGSVRWLGANGEGAFV